MSKLTQIQLGERIKKIRTESGLSQEDVAKRLNLSRQSIGQIEVGERDVTGIELAYLAELFGMSIDYLMSEETADEGVSKNKKTSLANIKFSADKLRNLLLYILARCGGKPNIGETVLYKLLYFIDFDSFELYGKPISGLTYTKMQFGPVPSTNQYNKVISKMVSAGELKIVTQLYGDMYQKKYVAFTDPAPESFSVCELKLIDGVISRLSDMNGRQIANYVHHDVPWMAVPMYQPIDYSLVFERTAPFAQTDRETMWQDASGEDTIKDLGSISKAEHDYYMNLK